MIILTVEAKDEDQQEDIEENVYGQVSDLVNDLQIANRSSVDLELYLVEDDSVEFVDE